MKSSIRQRGNTHTAYWFTVDPANGRRVQHSKGGFTTKKAAQARLNATLAKVEEGSWRPDEPLTVEQLLRDHWLPAQRSRELRASTLAQYTYAIDAWIVPKIGGHRVAALTPQQVVAFSEQLRTDRTSTGRRACHRGHDRSPWVW
ncbi:MAG: Arm DNA-binding domain-containing protein [Acidimicrobiales bacterium]